MRVVLLEFNELSPRLMEKFMAAGDLPNFRRLHDESEVAITEPDTERLEPWIQWIAVHSGVPFDEHGILHLNDGHRLDHDNLWDVLSDAGKKVWVCGSMNINYRRPINGWVLPDPWTTHVDPHPQEALETYHRFVSTQVQEHTREQSGLSRRDQLEFVRFMARHGLSPATVAAIFRQLVSERRSATRWRRASLFERLQFDLFRWYWKRERPDFATFFLNSTAHYQHRFWRHMEPEHFEVKPTAEERASYGDAILFGYQQMDRMVGQMMRLAGPDTMLVLLTGLSQQPSVKHEDIGGKRLYRPIDFQRLIDAIGLTGVAAATPQMAANFWLDFDTVQDAKIAEETLKGVRAFGRPAFGVHRTGTRIRTGCRIIRQLPPHAKVRVDGRVIPFFDLFYQLDLTKSGEHRQEGLMWVRSPSRTHSVVEERTPLVNVAPTILEMCGVRPPATMAGSPVGTFGPDGQRAGWQRSDDISDAPRDHDPDGASHDLHVEHR